jgi:hypothetical protein
LRPIRFSSVVSSISKTSGNAALSASQRVNNHRQRRWLE